MQAVFAINGLPELNARLDKIARVVAGPVTREALEEGGKVIQQRAESLVHRLTGMLAADIVVVTRVREGTAAVGSGETTVGEKYVLIGPGFNPDLTRHSGISGGPYASKVGAMDRGAAPRNVRAADASTNPGVYGYFLEVGHRSPGKGLNSNAQFKRDQAAARKQGKRLNSYTDPSSAAYGNLTTPAYPWLEPAFNQTKDEALQKMAEVIEKDLGALGL